MKKLITVFVLMVLLGVPAVACALDGPLYVEARMVKKVVSADEPIYVELVAVNMSDTSIPTTTTSGSYPSIVITHVMGYELRLYSGANGTTQLAYDLGYMPCSWTGNVPPHSAINLYRQDIKTVSGFPQTLEPGIYHIKFGLSWPGMSEMFWSDVCFIVEGEPAGEAIINAVSDVNTNVAATQEALSTKIDKSSQEIINLLKKQNPKK